jgi:hypothetical protein
MLDDYLRSHGSPRAPIRFGRHGGVRSSLCPHLTRRQGHSQNERR